MALPELPSSYASLPYKEIKLAHHPANAPTPTPIIVLTLHRPNAANAFTPNMGREIVHAYSLIDRDDRVKCVVMTGHGKMFCAGSDMNMGFQGEIKDTRAKDHRDGYTSFPTTSTLLMGDTAVGNSRLPSTGAASPPSAPSMGLPSVSASP